MTERGELKKNTLTFIMVSVNQESSGTLAAATANKHACHSLQIGNLVIVV